MKSISQLLAILANLRIKLSDRYDLLSGKFVKRVPFTGRVPASSLLGSHVLHIVQVCAKPEVIGANAQRVVPIGAVVKNVQAVSRAVVDNPRENVAPDIDASLRIWIVLKKKSSISPPGNARACPEPARISLVNLLPKSVECLFRNSLLSQRLRVYRSHVVSFSSVCLTGATELLCYIMSVFRKQSPPCPLGLVVTGMVSAFG